MSKGIKIENELVKKSRPRFGSKRYNLMALIAKSSFATCEICGAFLLNPQSIIIHQGQFCQNKKNKTSHEK